MPASSMAAILSPALPLEPLMMAPAWPMRLPGGAVSPATKPKTGLGKSLLYESRGPFFRVAPDLADHHHRVGVRIGGEHGEQRRVKFSPMIGSPPMPMQVDWPRPAWVSWCTTS